MCDPGAFWVCSLVGSLPSVEARFDIFQVGSLLTEFHQEGGPSGLYYSILMASGVKEKMVCVCGGGVLEHAFRLLAAGGV